MTSKAKTEKKSRTQSSQNTQKHQNPKKKTDTIKIVKAVLLGPTIAILSVTLIYIAWWGISKLFIALNGVVTEYFKPWVSENWPIFVGVWALVALTSVLYHFYEQNQKQVKKEKRKKVATKNSELELSEEELDRVVSHPYESDEDFKKHLEEIDRILGESSYDFISQGKPII